MNLPKFRQIGPVATVGRPAVTAVAQAPVWGSQSGASPAHSAQQPHLARSAPPKRSPPPFKQQQSHGQALATSRRAKAPASHRYAPARSRAPALHGAPVSQAPQLDPAEVQFLAEVGGGEFGSVYHGRYRGQDVAVKVGTGAGVVGLRAEGEILEQLRSPYIANFVAASYSLSAPLLLTDFAWGGSLYHLLHETRPRLPLSPHRINMALQLAAAAKYLHYERVVHADLKSLNIVVDSGLNVLVCDFGLAHRIAGDGSQVGVRGGGSPRYMSPELLLGEASSFASDIWAVGCIAAEIFGGPFPYNDVSDHAELAKRVTVDKRLPTLPELPSGIASALRGCLLFQASARSSASQLYSTLWCAKSAGA